MRTPIALTVFNRADITARVFSAIARARPQKLYVIADAPRAGRPGEAENCAAARRVIDRVDWDCKVVKNYSDTNLGPKRRLSTGLRWVFEQEPEAIFLEHDCLPHSTFFPFCEQLLEKYRDDRRVMHIGGTNFLFGRVPMQDSYHFSCITQPWGLATWRRAWQYYDVEMTAWPALRNTALLTEALLGDKRCVEFFRDEFDKTHDGRINTWDHQWLLACWQHHGLAVYPRTNLISNIGFWKGALYCGDTHDILSNLPTKPMHFPLRHPVRVERHGEADQFLIERVLVPGERQKMNKWRRLLPNLRNKLAVRSRIKALIRNPR